MPDSHMMLVCPQPQQHQYRILVIDQDRDAGDALCRQLISLGYHVPARVASAEGAFDAAMQVRPDLVLMTTNPEGAENEVKTANFLRNQLHVSVVFLTPDIAPPIPSNQSGLEPCAQIRRSCEPQELQAAIEQALYRRRLERRLDEQQRWFAAMLRSIGDGVAATDEEGNVTYLNPVAEHLTGWAKRDAIGRGLEEILPLADEETGCPTESPLHLAMQLRRSVPANSPRRLVARDGTEKVIDACVSPILDEAGALLGSVLIFRDITEQRQLERQIRQSQKMEAIGRLAGGIAHDFNNLLTIINGYSQLLMTVLADSDKERSLVEQIHMAGERAAGLTRQLLIYSRKQHQQLRPVDVNETIANLQKMLGRVIGEDIELLTELHGQPCRVMADISQLEQVIMNLVINARDAMPEGGKLTLKTSHVHIDKGSKVEVAEIEAGDYVVLRVIDTGSGMDEKTISRIFEPFFTTKEQGRGTGLGLATAYGIIKQSGGHIHVSSKPGKGATFTIYLPLLGEVPRELAAEESQHHLPKGNETILLVEDEDEVRRLTRCLLEQSGYRVIEAANGEQAIRLCVEHRRVIDLLITDVVMPKMNGRQVATALRRLFPRLQVLYISGYSGEAVHRHGVAESEADFIHKPFTLGTLAPKIRQILDRAKASTSGRTGNAHPADGCRTKDHCTIAN